MTDEKPVVPMDSAPRFQILALDGGGIRGVFTAATLTAIEEDHNVRIVDHFDLIGGTSTGGIVALALGLGISPREVVEFYVQHGPRIFANPGGWRSMLHWIRPKFSDANLRNALQSILGDRRFGDSTKRLVIPSFNIAENDVYVFRTPHLPYLRRDYRAFAWQVAMATAAAPTYFPTFLGLDGLRLVDGGLWANNPSMVALVEAVGPLGIPQEHTALLSLGTVSALKAHDRALDSAGKVGWAPHAPDVILDATAIGVNNQLAFLLGADRYYRVNALATQDSVSLDNAGSVDDLIGRARHVSRKQMPEIARRFLSHRAKPYSPLIRMEEVTDG